MRLVGHCGEEHESQHHVAVFCHERGRKKYRTHKLPYLGVHALRRPVLEAFEHLVGVHVLAEEVAEPAQERLVQGVFLDLLQVNANDVSTHIATSSVFEDLSSDAQRIFHSVPPALNIIQIIGRRLNSAGVSSDLEDRRRHRVWWVVNWCRCRELVLSEQVCLCGRWPACRLGRLLEFSPILRIIPSIIVVFLTWSAQH